MRCEVGLQSGTETGTFDMTPSRDGPRIEKGYWAWLN